MRFGAKWVKMTGHVREPGIPPMNGGESRMGLRLRGESVRASRALVTTTPEVLGRT